MIRKVLVAVDHSDRADRVLRFAASLARGYHAQVFLVHAFLPVSCKEQEPYSSMNHFETEEQAQSLAEKMSQQLKELGIQEIETEVRGGPAAHVILGASETYQPDILLIGARGSSTWQGAHLGSVSMAVAQRAECPVLIVR